MRIDKYNIKNIKKGVLYLMKNRILHLLFIITFSILLFFLAHTNVMALGDSYIIKKSPETYTMGTEQYPHWIEIFDAHDKIQKRVFLYEVEISNGVEWPSSPVVDPKNPSIKLYDPNLRENERLEYQYVWGQVFYWSVPNNGNFKYSSTLKGLPRYVYAANPLEEYSGTLLYPFDIGDKETELIINPATIVYHPWENGSSIKMDNGQVNKDFERLGITDDIIMTYKTFRTFYPSIERLINAKKNDPKYKKYEDPDDPLKKETAIFLDYIVCRTYAGIDSYGWFELKVDLDPNGSHLYRYITARTPKLIQNEL